jgi:hypothetical protein
MSASDRPFSETSPRRQRKFCGNCARVSFGLNKEEADFLNEQLRWNYALETVRKWLEKGSVKLPGSGGPDPQKMRAIGIISNHKKFCRAAAVDVFCIDTPCFLWLPRESAKPNADPARRQAEPDVVRV